LVIIAEVRFLNLRTVLAILMTNSKMEIELSKAPRIFFDQDKWAEYVAHFDTEEIALMHLSSPPGIDFSWWKDPMKPDEAVRVRKEKIFKHKMDLIQNFYKRLENNSIIASGRSFNSPQRIPIPPERWRDLWPAFIGDRAIGPTLQYTEVLVSINAESPAPHAELTERCESYLRARCAAGEVPKKETLREEANEHFGFKVPVRVFASAYKAVFDKRRGRPRIEK
jgi:hypothetical protein